MIQVFIISLEVLDRIDIDVGKVPENPKSNGQIILYSFAIKKNESFRPEGWQQNYRRWLLSSNPKIICRVRNSIPKDHNNEFSDVFIELLEQSSTDVSSNKCGQLVHNKMIEVYSENIVNTQGV